MSDDDCGVVEGGIEALSWRILERAPIDEGAWQEWVRVKGEARRWERFIREEGSDSVGGG